MLRTEIQLSSSPISITLGEKVLTTGSCFSDSIGTQLSQNKFNTLVNPFGVIYNPYSIHKVLRYALHNQIVPDQTYLKNQDIFSNYDFHSKFSSLQKKDVEKNLKDTIGVSHYFLKDANWLLITYGTSWVYERSDTGEIVANCHKIAAANFTKSLLSQKKVLDSFDEFYKDLKTFNPGIRIILTVSPVRHLKDTLQANSISKAVLRLACQTITETYSDAYYFPAYEIMIDDLRDYRFYKPDMLHPSEEAEAYIWNKFSACFFDPPSKEFIQQWQQITTALQHKPFHIDSAAHQSFLKKTLVQLEKLRTVVDVEEEISSVKSKLN